MEKEHAFMNLLKGNEMLLGILLGYGENNAKLYARRMSLRKFITGKTLPMLGKKPLPSKGFPSIEREFWIRNRRKMAKIVMQISRFCPKVNPYVTRVLDKEQSKSGQSRAHLSCFCPRQTPHNASFG